MGARVVWAAPALLALTALVAEGLTAPAGAASPVMANRARPQSPVERGAPRPLPAPTALVPFSRAGAQGQGTWRPFGRRVFGQAAVFETDLLPPAGGAPAGIAWMDTKLLRATLYSGSGSPGGSSWHFSAPIKPGQARTLVGAFNGGFYLKSSNGGYYSEGKLVAPLRPGAASLVIYRDGTATVGEWGRDATMTKDVAAVRQNLNLIVDQGRPVAGLNPYDTSVWGSTLGGIPDVWRSGLGITRNGALVYVAGAALNVSVLAQLLARAGAVRAMELDINPYWTVFATYRPATANGLASSANGIDLISTMYGQPDRFFTPSWARDFVTMSARP
ncbi:MAG TPA: phosphodiester glycosidase family protein [Acidimicrobiales bacterium]|nr:phosphodiester glycosidase family protein [Acidimicrobiales bacterium]